MLPLTPRMLTGALLGACLVPMTAAAIAVTFNFAGTVTQVRIDDLGALSSTFSRRT